MQDFKETNKAEQKGKVAMDSLAGQAFDKLVQKHLEQAEIPAPDLMDKIFSSLEGNERGEKTTDIFTRARKHTWKFQIKAIKIAAIAVVLIGLALGLSYINRNPTKVVPNNVVLNEANEPQTRAERLSEFEVTEKQGQGNEKEKLALKNEAIEPLEPETENNVEKKVATRVAKISQKVANKEAAIQTSNSEQINVDQGALASLDDNMEDGNLSGLHPDKTMLPEQLSKTPNKVVKLSGPDFSTEINNTAQAHVQKMSSMALNAQNETKNMDASIDKLAVQRLDEPRREHRKRRGLLRNLLQNVTRRAQEISEEVVQEQEDKTVINIGIVAITAYK